jgi:hypothetical protein
MPVILPSTQLVVLTFFLHKIEKKNSRCVVNK